MKHSRLFKCISLFLAAIMLLTLLSMILSASFVLPENPIAKASSFPDSELSHNGSGKNETPTPTLTPTPEQSETPTPDASETPTPEASETPTPDVSETPTFEPPETAVSYTHLTLPTKLEV